MRVDSHNSPKFDLWSFYVAESIPHQTVFQLNERNGLWLTKSFNDIVNNLSWVKLDYHTSKRQQPQQNVDHEKSSSPISAEWDAEWPGPQVIVEVSEKSPNGNGTNIDDGPKIIVRTDEVLIVVAVLLLWVGAIALFFNRWGKIRMLEPYQPKFQQQHRSSCPLVELEAIPPHKHPSFSRVSMGTSLQMPPTRMGSISGATNSSLYTVRAPPLYSRNRQNSVFVGPQYVEKPSRKYQSAMDIHSMVLDEAPEPV